MRILWSIHLYPPIHNCGSEYVAHHVNKHLLKQGHEVHVIMHHYGGSPYKHEGVWVFPGTGLVDAYRWADVICTHLDMTQYTMIMAREANRPVVHFTHNDIPYECLRLAGGKQFVVHNSDWVAEKLKYPFPSTVLHPPCDYSNYNVGADRNGAITLISLNERKGGYLFSKIAEAMPERKFIGVLGSYDNPGTLKLKQADIVKMMPPNVEIVQNTPNILDVYRRTRILLMPSDYESWGRTATEAMCSGIPVICTPTPGLKENCLDAAIYVGEPIEANNPGDCQVKTGKVSDWVNAIRSLDDKKRYNKYAQMGISRARELSPVKELESLEKFLYRAANS